MVTPSIRSISRGKNNIDYKDPDVRRHIQVNFILREYRNLYGENRVNETYFDARPCETKDYKHFVNNYNNNAINL